VSPQAARYGRQLALVSGSGVSIELSEGQLRAAIRGALASNAEPDGLPSLDLSCAVSTAAGRALFAARSDTTMLSLGLIRGLSVLNAFGERGPARGTSEVADELKMGVSTVNRYIRTLVALGLLCPESRSRLYRRAASMPRRKGDMA
jgi:hypothetical protein